MSREHIYPEEYHDMCRNGAVNRERYGLIGYIRRMIAEQKPLPAQLARLVEEHFHDMG